MEVADVAAEIFIAPLFVVPVPLQVALSVQLLAAALIGPLSVQLSG